MLWPYIYLSKYLGSSAELRDEGMGQMEGNRMDGFQRIVERVERRCKVPIFKGPVWTPCC